MRRKKLISPEKPQQDSIEYRFKLLFWPYLSYAIVIAILGAFIFGIFLVSFEPINIAILNSLYMLFTLLIVEVTIACAYPKICSIILTPEGIRQKPRFYKRMDIDWNEIVSIKSSYLFGVRSLVIKRKEGSFLIFTPYFFETTKILDRVRELAGEDHILVRALEKELSRPRYELTKLWVGIIGSIAVTMSIYLIGGNMYAAEQEKPLEQAIATYVRQHPKTAPNESAIELQALMTKLGLSVEAFGNGSEVKVKPAKSAIDEWKAIEPVFKKYLDKQKTQQSIEPIPQKLVSYLQVHQTDINAIETQLINNPISHWGSDTAWIGKSDPKGGDSPSSKWINGFSLLSIENIMIVNIFDKQQVPNAEFYRDLTAIEKIQQSFQTQPSLLGQLYRRIGEHKISDLVRQIDLIPIGWGNNLFRLDRHQQMISAIENESMWFSRMLQKSSTLDRILINENNYLRHIPGYFHLFRPHIRLGVVNRHREVEQGLSYWSKQNICHTDGLAGIIPTSLLGIHNYNVSTSDITSQYQKVLRSDLRWEATNVIRQVKAKLAAGQKVDRIAREFKIPSQVCSDEKWIAQANDGSVKITFSHPPNWKALGVKNSVDIDPLAYTIKPIDR